MVDSFRDFWLNAYVFDDVVDDALPAVLQLELTFLDLFLPERFEILLLPFHSSVRAAAPIYRPDSFIHYQHDVNN